MSFLARMEIDGEEMNVLECSFGFSQNMDASGKPTSKPQCRVITVLLESTDNTHLFDWMLSATQQKNGTITFFRRDGSSRFKTLEFVDAYCVDYFETYEHSGGTPMQIKMQISPLEVKLNDSEYKNNWPV